MDKMIAHSLFLKIEDSKNRSHWVKLRGERFKRYHSGSSLTHGVASIWNELPEEAVEVDSYIFQNSILYHFMQFQIQANVISPETHLGGHEPVRPVSMLNSSMTS